MSKQEFMKSQTVVLRVNIHCDGCKQKVKKLLQKIEGVYSTSIDAEQGKVTVTGTVDPSTLIRKLDKSGKHAELWSSHFQRGPNHPQNYVQNQFKNMQIDSGKVGKGTVKDKQKGGRGGGGSNVGGAQQEAHQKLKQGKGSKEGKTVTFNLPDQEDEFDSFDDFDDDDEYYDDDGFGHGHGHHHLPSNKMMMPMAMPMGKGHGFYEKEMKDDGRNGNGKDKGSGGGGKVAAKKGGLFSIFRGRGKDGKKDEFKGRNGRKGGKGKEDGKNGSEIKDKDGKKDDWPSSGKKGDGGKKGNQKQSGGAGGGDRQKGGGVGGNINNDKKGGKKGNSQDVDISSYGRGVPGSYAGPTAGPSGYYPVGQMGNVPAVHGLPAPAGMNGGYYNQGMMGQGGIPYGQQQQYMTTTMNQQRSDGYGFYQPVMYGGPQHPYAMNYAPPMPPSDSYAHFFSDENTDSCSIM